MNLLKRINWPNTLFLLLVPIAGIVGTILLTVFGFVHWPTWLLAFVLTVTGGLSITGGYHRLFAHKSYKAHWTIRLLFVLFGSSTFEGSVLEWCTDHRNHHRHTDTDKDPYSIKRGFWYAHIGWLFMLDTTKRDYSNVSDLKSDPILRFQFRYFALIAVTMGLILPTGLAALWGDPLGGLFVAGLLRVTLNQHFTFCINSVCHWFGKKPYSDRQSAKDHWVTALFTFGEGFHNFHHQFPIDYRNGVRFYHFDPTKWLIRTLSFVGLAHDLKSVTAEQILRYKVRLHQKTLQGSMISSASEFLTQLESQIEAQLETIKAPKLGSESI